jgi:hypothetical protein
MSSEGFTIDAAQETRIVVQSLKIERLEEKQAELLERIRGLEKWVFGAAAVISAGLTLLGLLAQISKAYL